MARELDHDQDRIGSSRRWSALFLRPCALPPPRCQRNVYLMSVLASIPSAVAAAQRAPDQGEGSGRVGVEGRKSSERCQVGWGAAKEHMLRESETPAASAAAVVAAAVAIAVCWFFAWGPHVNPIHAEPGA